MSAQLGPPLIHLFAPRAPVRYIPPADDAPEKRTTTTITGIAEYLAFLGKEETEYQATETFEEAKLRRRQEKKEAHRKAQQQALEDYNPNEDTQVRGDPFKTLFVSRLSYDVTEDDLQREFGRYGPIQRIRIVQSTKDQKPRGYAFLVFEHERDMKDALRDTDGMKIKDRRTCVDVERGRTVKGWKPMRLGGGRGGRRQPGKPIPGLDASAYRGQPRSYNDRSAPMPARGNGYSSRDDRPRDRSAPRSDRPSDRYDRQSDRPDRHDRGYAAPPPRNYEPMPHPSHDRSRQGRQGIGLDRAPDPRAFPSRPPQDSRINFTPSSSQPPLDPRARQPPTTYASTVPSAPSAPWLASGHSSSDSRRERPSYEDDRDRDTKRRRY